VKTAIHSEASVKKHRKIYSNIGISAYGFRLIGEGGELRMDAVKGPDITRESWLCDLMRRYKNDLLRIGFVYLRDASLAEDAAQETLMKAYQADFRGESNEKTWLMRIAINTCKDMRRSAWFRYVDRHVKPESLPQACEPFSREDERLTLAVMALPAKQMAVVLLYYYQGMSLKEISESLSIAISTVSARLTHARKKLRVSLEGEGMHESSSNQ